MFFKALCIGFAFTLGVELALGLCIAIDTINRRKRGRKK